MYIYVVGSVASDGSKDNSAFISRIKQSKKGWGLLGMFDPVQEGTTTIRNAVNYKPSDTALYSTTPQSSLLFQSLFTV
jgi:hypothetical protein